jgi:putative two-component system response regulator
LLRLKSNAVYENIPVIFLTGKNDAAVEESVFEMGAVDFIVKPFYAPVLLKRIKTCLDLEDLVRERTALAEMQARLADERYKKLEKLRNGMVSVLAKMVESRDEYTGWHIERTSRYIKILIETMIECSVYSNEMDEWRIEGITSSARLHDIGKIIVSDVLLNAKGKLTAEEFELMKSHAKEGERIIESIIEKSGEGAFLNNAKLFAAHHHERWDGKGYPHGLKGEDISLQGRIMAIADVYDALVSERPYKEALTHEQAVETIADNRGKHFDPYITDVFLKVCDMFGEVSS